MTTSRQLQCLYYLVVLLAIMACHRGICQETTDEKRARYRQMDYYCHWAKIHGVGLRPSYDQVKVVRLELNPPIELNISDGENNYTIAEETPSAKFDDFLESVNDLTALLKDFKAEQKRKVECQRNNLRKNCIGVVDSEAKKWNGDGGVFDIYPGDSGRAMEVYCDTKTDGGGWIVFQRRIDGSQSFERDFAEYVSGFGQVDKEFWLGLEKLHVLTKSGRYELRVDLTDWDNNTAYAYYSDIFVGSASTQYELKVSGYLGSAGDSLTHLNGRRFYARFRDCPKAKGAWAWWYNSCSGSNLNGVYIDVDEHQSENTTGIEWPSWKNGYSMKYTEMKIRIKW